MKRVFIVLFLIINSVVSARTYYVSTTGKDSNPGTKSEPWLTWQKGFSSTTAGDTCYFRGGVYMATVILTPSINSGTRSHPTCFFNYPAETPIFDFKNIVTTSWSPAIQLNSKSNLHIKGLTLRNNYQKHTNDYCLGWKLYSCNNVTFENCVVHNIGGSGYSASDRDTTYYINCDVYNCCDSLTAYDKGGGGFGFIFNTTDAPNSYISYKWCRAWKCSDNGFGCLSDGVVVYDSCWAFDNGFYSGQMNPNGEGFKLGWTVHPKRSLVLTVHNCIGAHNQICGFTDNDDGWPQRQAHIYNNFMYRNGYDPFIPSSIKYGFFIQIKNTDTIGTYNHWYRNNISYFNDEGKNSGDYQAVSSNYINEEYNAWNNDPRVTDADFLSLDWTELYRPRKADGSLPDINFGKLASTSDLIDAGKNVGLPFNGSAPDLGAFEAQTGSVPPVSPVYTGSTIENSAPAKLEMTYNLSLANIVPAASAFTVRVNSVSRTVSSVSISGTKVILTLGTPVVYGDALTVAYTKPATNPLQTPAGGHAVNLSAQNVTNNVIPVSPVYVSSAIEAASPGVIEMTYNLTLSTTNVPAPTYFIVKVNGVTRGVNTVTISGTKVLLALVSPVTNGDAVTVSYSKPTDYPLQTPAGGQAAALSAQVVTNKLSPLVPVYISSAIENTAPAQLEMIYDMTLANIVPLTSAFSVRVNSVTRSIISVAVSGTKVLLTLSGPAASGDIVTVSYTKPATNPLQSPSGGQAASISSQTVTNRVNPTIPAYISSAVENTTPDKLEMIYNLNLADIVPLAAAFTVLVNSVVKTVSAVAISGEKVLLTLSTPVIFGDVITISYTKPVTNPLQSTTGGQAVNLVNQSVINRVGIVNDPPVILTDYSTTCYSGFIGEIDASGSYDPNGDNLTFEWSFPSDLPVSSSSSSRIQFLAPVVTSVKTAEFILRISDGNAIQTQNILVSILPYRPDLERARIIDLGATSYLDPYSPSYLFDSNTETLWSSDGYDQNVTLCMEKINKINHVMLAFPDGLVRVAYFDLYASSDSIVWDPVLIHAISCPFSGNLQVFEFPVAYSGTDYTFLKLVGQGSQSGTRNYISELRIFGSPQGYVIRNNQSNISVFPNPANDFITVVIKEPSSLYQFIRICDFSGKIVLENEIDPAISETQIAVGNFSPGFYCIQIGTKTLTFFVKKLIIDRW